MKICHSTPNLPKGDHLDAEESLRVGAVAFILNGLLGVDEDELYKDWEATVFWNPRVAFCHEQRFDKLVAVFADFPGKTLNERIVAYVKSLGFTDADISRFRELMLEASGGVGDRIGGE